MELKEIENLSDKLKDWFGISNKQAQKIIYRLLEIPQSNIEKEFKDFQFILNTINKCKICNDYTTSDKCLICLSNSRQNQLMVVENSNQIRNYEKWKIYQGKYFQIPFLFNKKFELIKKYDLSFFLDYCKSFDEIIISISPTIEGIMTSNYLFEKLNECYPNLKITKLATGIQVGSMIDYTDKLTMHYALKDRKEIKK